MAAGAWETDTREFRRAIREYELFSGKTLMEVHNRTMKNVALRTVKGLPKAARNSIVSLTQQDWWPKYIAKILAGSESYTRASARRFSRKIIRSRTRSVSFMKSGFLKAGIPLGAKGTPKKGMTKSFGRGILATSARNTAELLVEYVARSGKDRSNKERMAYRAMRAAIRFVTKDMEKYINRKLAEKAKKISFR